MASDPLAAIREAALPPISMELDVSVLEDHVPFTGAPGFFGRFSGKAWAEDWEAPPRSVRAGQ